MLEVPMHNLLYDFEILNKNAGLKEIVDVLSNFMKDNVRAFDFEDVSEDQKNQLQTIRAILNSKENENCAVFDHAINYYMLNQNNSNDSQECGLLHFACAFGRLEEVEYLFKTWYELSINAVSHIFQSPIQFAIAVGNSPEMVGYLLGKGATVLLNKDLLVEDSSEELPMEIDSDDDGGSYTIVDALKMSWNYCGNNDKGAFFERWVGIFSDICQDEDVMNDLENKFPVFFQ